MVLCPISSLIKDLLLGGPCGSTDWEKIVRSTGNASGGKSTLGCWEGGEFVCGIDRCNVVFSEFTCGWMEANGHESDSEIGSDGGGEFANGQLELGFEFELAQQLLFIGRQLKQARFNLQQTQDLQRAFFPLQGQHFDFDFDFNFEHPKVKSASLHDLLAAILLLLFWIKFSALLVIKGVYVYIHVHVIIK